MKWTHSSDIKAQVNRLWKRGDICRSAVVDDDTFPFQLRLKQPSAKVILDDWAGTQDWVNGIRAYAQKQHIHLDWHTVNHRVLGRQELPYQLVLETPKQAAQLLGQVGSLKQFSSLYQKSMQCLPEVQPWLLQYPLKALALQGDWQRVLDLCAWMKVHPNPRIYLRQVDVKGVDSKFIESNRKVLAELFDCILPVFAINDDYSGVAGFARGISRQ